MPRRAFPFAAIVGQDEMKLALLLNAVDPRVGGVMIMGHRGTAKTTAVRGLAEIVPAIEVVKGCAFNCPPDQPLPECEACSDSQARVVERRPLPVVDLPLGATEDRVAGTLDLQAALTKGEKRFEPGLLAAAHRGFLYIDEVNLLEDHLVDLLLDVAAGGEHVVERESVSVRHPARFVLVGTGNPEEGSLRPQLLDRFGLSATIATETDLGRRTEIVARRLLWEDHPDQIIQQFDAQSSALRAEVEDAQQRIATIRLPIELITKIAAISAELEIDGHRGELACARAARACAALRLAQTRADTNSQSVTTEDDLRRVLHLALRHRLRKDPLETRDLAHRISEAQAKYLAPSS